MSEKEQDDHYGKLLVTERKLEKKLACLRSKCRTLRTVLESVISSLEGHVNDFEQVRTHYAEVSNIDIAGLIDAVEETAGELYAVQKDIRAIEGRLLPHERSEP